jgi:hypothetical protein
MHLIVTGATLRIGYASVAPTAANIASMEVMLDAWV